MAPAWWASGKHGSLSPWSQAKVWALHTVSKELELDLEHADIAKRVKKVGGGHPGAPLICRMRKLLEADPDWYAPNTCRNALQLCDRLLGLMRHIYIVGVAPRIFFLLRRRFAHALSDCGAVRQPQGEFFVA